MTETTHANEAADGQSRLTAELGADFDNTEERYLRETIAMLNAHHEKMIKPYIDRLVEIHKYRPQPAMMVTREQADALGLLPPNAKLTGLAPREDDK